MTDYNIERRELLAALRATCLERNRLEARLAEAERVLRLAVNERHSDRVDAEIHGYFVGRSANFKAG